MDIEEKYKNLIEGKKVIFVGPAPTLKDQNKGKWIDEDFDLVIRTNGASLLLKNKEFKKDYGSKMDILYCNVQFHREMKPLPLERWKIDHGLQFVNFKVLKESYEKIYSTVIPVRGISTLIKKLQHTVPSILMGPIILKDILQFNPERLYFTGMDFYIDKPDMFIPGDYREYYPGYLPKKIVKKADVDNVGKIDNHEQYENCKIVYNLYKNGEVETDKQIVKIMETIISDPLYYSVKGRRKRIKDTNLKKQLKRSVI